MTHPRLLRRPHPTASRGPNRAATHSSTHLDNHVFRQPPRFSSATLCGPKKIALRGPQWPSVVKKVFFRGPSWTKRCSSRPFADQRKVFSAPLRGQKGVLRDPSRPFADQRKVFSAPLHGQKRYSSRPFVDKKVFFATLRAPSRIKERCSPRPSADKKGILRGPSWTKRCSSRPFAPLRAIKERCSPRPSASSADKKGVLRDPSRPFADQRKVFLTALRGQTRSPFRNSTANQPK